MYRRLRIPVKPLLVATLLVWSVVPATPQTLEERLDRSRALEDELADLTDVLLDGDPTSVLAAIDALRADVEADARWANLEGLALAASGDHRAAVGRFTAGLRIDPDLAELHTNLAVSLVELGATGRALSEFEQATALDPESVDAHLGWGRELHRLGRHAQALEPLQRARQLAPNDPRVLSTLADAAAAAGRTELALEVWRRLDDLAPDVRSARRRGELLAPTDVEAAIAAYDTCAARDPEAVDCREAAASLELAAGRPDGAVRRLLPVVEALSDLALANLYVALWNAGRGDELPALADRRPPGSGPGWGVLALALRDVGRAEEAREAVESGLEVDPDAPGLHVLRGAILEESGRREQARAAWRRALELDPGNVEARANLEATGGR